MDDIEPSESAVRALLHVAALRPELIPSAAAAIHVLYRGAEQLTDDSAAENPTDGDPYATLFSGTQQMLQALEMAVNGKRSRNFFLSAEKAGRQALRTLQDLAGSHEQ